MTTHPTLAAALLAAATAPQAQCVIEIDHASQGRCWIVTKAPLTTLAAALRQRPLPEIVQLVAEYPLSQPAPRPAPTCRCERCGETVNADTSYRQQEWTRFGGKKVRVMAYYCSACTRLLGAIGQGEHTELQARAGARPVHEMDYPRD